MQKIPFIGLVGIAGFFLIGELSAQRPGPPPGGPGQRPGGRQARQHTETESQPLRLVPANRNTPAASEVSIKADQRGVRIESNSIPDHKVGRFPNSGNPNEIREQNFDVVVPANPEEAGHITYINGSPNGGGRRGFRVFGITLDGVMMEPGTAESWMGQMDGWNYEALGGAIDLGLDANYAHVQPGGTYHYHGLPIGLMKRLGYKTGDHSPMIGWAADGFPIYAMYGYKDPLDPNSGIEELTTSYQLRKGNRPGGTTNPGGEYDGAFVQDYEFVAGSGTLDECNGRFCVTPEFPDGTYAYFLSREWPVLPRAFRGTPVELKFGNEIEGFERPGRGRPPFPPPGGGPPPR